MKLIKCQTPDTDIWQRWNLNKRNALGIVARSLLTLTALCLFQNLKKKSSASTADHLDPPQIVRKKWPLWQRELWFFSSDKLT